MKRTNELDVSGLISTAYMERLFVEIKQVRIELVRIKQELLTVSNKIGKYYCPLNIAHFSQYAENDVL